MVHTISLILLYGTPKVSIKKRVTVRQSIAHGRRCCSRKHIVSEERLSHVCPFSSPFILQWVFSLDTAVWSSVTGISKNSLRGWGGRIQIVVTPTASQAFADTFNKLNHNSFLKLLKASYANDFFPWVWLYYQPAVLILCRIQYVLRETRQHHMEIPQSKVKESTN